MSQNGTNDSNASETAPWKPPHRRLVVMFDGTANTRASMTNVSRMFEAIDDSHPESYKCIGSDASQPPFLVPAFTKMGQCGTCNQPMLEAANREGDDSKAYFRAGFPCGSCHQLVVEPELQPVQLVKYIPGVGTNHKQIGWVTGQTLGYGLSEKIIEGYTWLCENYQQEDDVFVFGFSRGAFAARSLVSLLHKCDGVLKKPGESGNQKEAIEKAYAYYRGFVESTDEKMEGEHRRVFDEYLRKHKDTIEPLQVRVKMLGVWDTVGALGIRINSGLSIIDKSVLSRKHYQFHDQDLSGIVDNAYHALALDECRKDFEPTLWTSRASTTQEVKQVWFVGSHCNVGGGADLDDNDDPDDLWQYSYVWMQRHAEKHGLRFFWSYESPATRQANSHLRTRRVSLREPEPSYEKFAWGLYSKVGSPFNRETDPKLAMLHWSVIERIKVASDDPDVQRQAPRVKEWKPYRPGSLLGNLCSHEFLETVIPEGSTPDQVDAKGTPELAAPKWHIETDDVMAFTQWALKPRDVKNEKLE